jgi:hypothetical protein
LVMLLSSLSCLGFLKFVPYPNLFISR